MRKFRFNRPEGLDAFVGHLTAYQLSRLHSIAIGLTVCLATSTRVRLGSFARLPTRLQYIDCRVYPARNGRFGMARTIPGLSYDRDVDQEEFDLLDALVRQAGQSAPSSNDYLRRSKRAPAVYTMASCC